MIQTGNGRGSDGNQGALVPVRWLVVVVGSAISCLGTSFYLAFSIGSQFTSVTVGQESLMDRVTAIEVDRKVRIREAEDFQRKVLQDLSSLNTKADLILGGRIK